MNEWRKSKFYGNSIMEVFQNMHGISYEEFENQAKEYPLDVSKIVEYIEDAIIREIKITIIGDYDVDGVCASSILYKAIEPKIKNKSLLNVRIPKRFSEGYGLSESIIDEIDSGLVITVDNGISSLAAIKKGVEKGLKVIVTDHHIPQGEVPKADLILDPHLSHEEFEDYCGAGIAYRIGKELTPELSDTFMGLAAIATIADVMPLVKENRYIVKNGLKKLLQPEKLPIGLNYLLADLNLNHHIDEEDISFKVAPCLNANGRLIDDGANISLELMLTHDSSRAIDLVRLTIENNEKRKKLVEEALLNANQYITDNAMFSDCPLVIYDKNIHEGIIGIVSGKLAEQYKVPVIIFTDSSDETLKGSGRSNKDINIYEFLFKHKDLYLKFGGHADACGILISKDSFHNIKNIWTEELYDYTPPLQNIYPYDYEADEKQIPYLTEELEKIKPFGCGNPNFKIKFEAMDLVPSGTSFYSIKGKDNQTIQLNTKFAKLVNFSLANKYLKEDCPKKVEVIGELGLNTYFNSYKNQLVISTQIIMDDFNKVKIEKKLSPLQRRLNNL